MAEKLGEALLDLDTNDSKFNQGVDRAEKRAVRLGKTFDAAGKKALDLGKKLALGATVAGIGALSFGIGSAVKRLDEMRKVSAQADRALANTGNTARTSAAEIEAWANILENKTGRAVNDVMAISANLASFGFGRAEFFRAIELANDMAAAWGGDLRQNLEGLSRALDDPINGMAMLSKRGIALTDEQKEMAKAFLEAGNKVAAQGVVFEALEAQVKGVAEAGFGGLHKALVLAQKAWDQAFESLVRGDGDAANLNATLETLIATLSSPEFISAAMGFGNLIVQMVNGIAQVVIGAHQALKDFYDFLDAPNRNRAQLPEGVSLKRVFPADYGAAEGDITRQLEWMYQRGGKPSADQLYADFAIGPDGKLVVQPPPGSMFGQSPFDPYEGFTYSGGGGGAKRDPVRDLIASLTAEKDLLRETDPVQRRLISLREQLATATTAQRDEVEGLIRTIHEETQAWENAQEAAQLFGDWAMNSLEGLRKGTKSLTDVVGDLIDALAQAVLQSMLLGQGPLAGLFGTSNANGGLGGLFGGLASLFSGFFADGGLIPNGSFGIVGEAGPEPVIGTPRGAQVLPNSALDSVLGGRGMVNNININGSNLSQAELSQAIRDALEQFSRLQLPGRVAAIQADPLAVG